MSQERIRLETLRLDADTQTRVELSAKRIEMFAECFRAREQLPPIDVFLDGDSHWIADGFHRAHGAIKAGQTHIAANVRMGNKTDCIKFGVGANKKHDACGLPRTNDDKRKSVTMLLMVLRQEGTKMSNREVARVCGVSHEMVNQVLAALATVATEEQPREPKEESTRTPSDPPELKSVADRDEEIVKRLAKGKRNKDIAAELGIKPAQVSEAKARKGIPPQHGGGRKRVEVSAPPAPAPEPSKPNWRKGKLDEKTTRLDKQVAELHAQGIGTGDIARAIGADSHSVSASKARQGLIKKDGNPLANLIQQAREITDRWDLSMETSLPLWKRATAEQQGAFLAALQNLIRAAQRLGKMLAKSGDENHVEAKAV